MRALQTRRRSDAAIAPAQCGHRLDGVADRRSNPENREFGFEEQGIYFEEQGIYFEEQGVIAQTQGMAATKGMERIGDMTQTKRYRSDALRSLHEFAEDLHDVGVIDKATMRHFDLSCLTRVQPITPEAIKRMREQSHMSQATFAR
jgi:hypothetical protein